MKKRLLSLILTACMLPGTAWAAEITVTADAVQKLIFANGLAITLQAKGSGTEILVNNAAVTLSGLTADSTGGYDLSAYTIIGGSRNAEVASTSITMEGGTVQTIFGGGMLASGGSGSANVTGGAEISITGGTVTAAVRAGGYDQNPGSTGLTATVGSATVAIGGTAVVTKNVELGGAGTTPAKVKVVGSAVVKLSGSPKIGSGTGTDGTGIVPLDVTESYVKVTEALTEAAQINFVLKSAPPTSAVLVVGENYTLTAQDMTQFTAVGAKANAKKKFALDASNNGVYCYKSEEEKILTFSFGVENEVVTGAGPGYSISITGELPYGTNVTALKPTFTLSEYATVKVGDVPQVSGVTVNDFTAPVSYIVTSESGLTRTYTVRVFVCPFPQAGTQEDPYLIQTEDDLFAMAAELELGNTFAGKFLKLTTDVALTKNWVTPMNGWTSPASLAPLMGTDILFPT